MKSLVHQKVCTIENRDMIFIKKQTDTFSSQNRLKTISENFTPIYLQTNPLKVIWHGSNYSVRNDTANKSSKKFLFVGSRKGYKNFSTAAKAFCEIAKNDPKARLVIAGAPPYQDELELLKDVQNQIDWKVFPQDNELIDLYSSSLALLYTSNYEGFGMPMVEAMSQGCIPIAGNHSSIPEVLGDAGLIVNTNSVSEVTSAMYKCITEDKFVENLQKKGFNRISEFDWYSTARKKPKFLQKFVINKIQDFMKSPFFGLLHCLC